MKRIYEQKKINTSFTKQELKALILLSTKGVHFTLCGESYVQTDGVAMCSPLGEILCQGHLMSWKRYVNDTNCFLKEDPIEHVMPVLNGFHASTQFTYETELNNRLSFLDVLIIRNGQSIETCVYRKPTNTDIYIHWNFSHQFSENAALKTLVYRSYLICSYDHYLTLEGIHGF